MAKEVDLRKIAFKIIENRGNVNCNEVTVRIVKSIGTTKNNFPMLIRMNEIKIPA